MKKLLLSAVAVLVAVSVANADPKFGLVAYTDAGHGVAVVDDAYTASLTFMNSGVDADNTTLSIGLNAAYKVSLDSSTMGLVGVRYSQSSGKVASIEFKSDKISEIYFG